MASSPLLWDRFRICLGVRAVSAGGHIEGERMATRYKHRIGVRSELFLTLTLDAGNPSPTELSLAVAEALLRAADSEGGIKLLEQVPEGVVYPDWNSVDPQVEAPHVLDPSVIRSVDCVEIEKIQ
jgi:hypothetical protein